MLEKFTLAKRPPTRRDNDQNNMRNIVTQTHGIIGSKGAMPQNATARPLGLSKATLTQGLGRPGYGKDQKAQPRPSAHDKPQKFGRADLVRAIFHELRFLQSQGAQFVFEARYPGDFSATRTQETATSRPKLQTEGQTASLRASTKENDHFAFLKLADFLILGQGGKTLLLKTNYKPDGQTLRSCWQARLMNLGHPIAYLDCETPLDGREQLRKLMGRLGYVGDMPKGQAGTSAKAKAEALFS